MAGVGDSVEHGEAVAFAVSVLQFACSVVGDCEARLVKREAFRPWAGVPPRYRRQATSDDLLKVDYGEIAVEGAGGGVSGLGGFEFGVVETEVLLAGGLFDVGEPFATLSVVGDADEAGGLSLRGPGPPAGFPQTSSGMDPLVLHSFLQTGTSQVNGT
jgi:hypothetical protein